MNTHASFRVLLLVFSLSGCGSLSRIETNAARAFPTGLAQPAEIRIAPTQAPQDLALAERLPAYPPNLRPAMLALSGGGANGAFGAGVMVGWSQSGERPQFDIVTGVSTGALTAPFAFLGAQWDDALQAVYTEGQTRHVMGWRNFAGFLAPSLFSSNGIDRLIVKNITPELLRDVAAEHAKGRRLLIATTNLDAETAVIWDMGVIASIGGENGLALFRSVLLASASLPGVFPPVLIDGVSPAGAAVREMHVDGGVALPFLGVPEALTTPLSRGNAPHLLYIVVNGQTNARYAVTGGHLRDIVSRSFEAWSNRSLRTALADNAAFANRNGIDVYMTNIPSNADASSTDFSPKAMRSLFEFGRTTSATGLVWSRVSAPGVATTNQAAIASAPSEEAALLAPPR
jgi:predicted acylesterase/phospholipase RssA